MADDVRTDDAGDQSGDRAGLLSRVIRLPAAIAQGARTRPLLAGFLATGTAIMLLAGVALSRYTIARLNSQRQQMTVAKALAELDRGEFEAARLGAMQLNREAGQSARKRGAALYILGAVFAHEAEQHWNPSEQATLYLVAARYLDEAQQRGIPAGREADGVFMLGNCLFHAGHYAESLPPLTTAVKLAPRRRADIYRLLATAYYRDTPAQLDRAREAVRRALVNPAQTPSERDELLLLRAEIELAAGAADAVLRQLDSLAPDSQVAGEAILVRAQVAMLKAQQLPATRPPQSPSPADYYHKATKLLERAQHLDRDGTLTRQARYLIGLCQHALHDDRAAELMLERTRRTHYHTPEAVAAALVKAEIQLEQRRYAVALESLLDVIDESGRPEEYANHWVPLAELRKRLQTAFDAFLAAQQTSAAVDLAQALTKIVPADVAWLDQARAHAAWGDQLTAQALTEAPDAAAVTNAEARIHFRNAGAAYRKLAELRFATKNYEDDLWNGGYYTLQGHNYVRALVAIQKYLNNAPRDRQARGLVALGEAQMALGQLQQAESSLRKCIALHPRHPDTYRARLLAAQVHTGLGTTADAETLLKTNLFGASLTPASPQWRESLFRLGQLHYRSAFTHETKSRKLGVDSADEKTRRAALPELAKATMLFGRAIQRLSDYIERDPTGPFAIEARYYVAEAWRHSAKYPRKSMPVEPTRARRAELQRKARHDLQFAADRHLALQQLLNQLQEQRPLNKLEQGILRNAYFAQADALFDLGDYAAAIKAYSAATNRYQHEPEALEAFTQIAACYQRLNAPTQARATIQHAIAVLSRIRKDAEFVRTTRYSRDQWNELLTWLAQW